METELPFQRFTRLAAAWCCAQFSFVLKVLIVVVANINRVSY